MAEPTLSEKLRTGNLFAEQCPSRDVLNMSPAAGAC